MPHNRAGGVVVLTHSRPFKGFSATLPAAAVEAIRRNPRVKYVETVDWNEANYAANWYGYQHQGVIGYVYLTP
ncbi:MAG TPA: protease inhibitor I9 family protein [Longimicrobium sp.]|uniref:protease inhibitor I9 family protein n=1 Tax=Longimicrobium sp. TaxID=2029185 RepID=UPI002ED9CF14